MTNKELKHDLSDREILVLTIVGEARGEPIEGQIAVANVIVNRALRRKISVKDVCLAPKQFSCWNENDSNRPLLEELAKEFIRGEYQLKDYKQIQWIVEGILEGKLSDNTKGSDHYMTTSLFNSDKRPKWASAPLKDPIIIGNHVFLNV
jgi:spore germination cell wall hydrolase CwlJ-like protein